MKLKELVDGNFAQLNGFVGAALSGKYRRGRDNVGMYALPEDKNEPDLLDAFEKYGFGEIFQAIAAKESARQAAMEHSVLIRGPLNHQLVVDVWLATKYFLENATDFECADVCGPNDLIVRARFPGLSPLEGRVFLAVDNNHYKLSFRGPTEDGKYFSMAMFSDPEIILPGVLNHMNDFTYETHNEEDGQFRRDRAVDFDVHVNGPANHVVIRDLLILGEAMKEYCMEQANLQSSDINNT